MMKRNIILFVFCLLFLGAKAQSMETLFANMPEMLIPQLDVEWRKDLIDLYKGGKEARLQNRMGGYSLLTKLTDNYLFLQTTERSTMEIRTFPLINNTKILCVVITVMGPVADSRVLFYTTDWEPLPAEGLFTSVAGEWFLKEVDNKMSSDYQDAISRLDMELIKYELNEKDETLTATYTTPLYLSIDDRNKVKPFLKDEPKVYKWSRSRFE